MRLKKTAPGIYQVSDQESAKECAKLETGMFVEVKKASKPRSLPEHRMFWAIATKTVENLNTNTSVDDFIRCTMLNLGFCKRYKMNGKQYEVPLSLKFSEMKQETFHQLNTKCIEVWSALLGCSPEELCGSVGDIE
jgi:hypothetical protein